MHIRLVTALLLLAVLSSAHAQQSPQLQWTEESVVGLSLELEDPVAVEQLHFVKGGALIATFGTKGGPLTGPVLRWKIVDGVLQFGAGDAPQQLTLLSRQAGLIVVKDRAGKTLRFHVLEH